MTRDKYKSVNSGHTEEDKEEEKQYTHLDVRKAVIGGRLIYASCYHDIWNGVPKKPNVDKNSTLVGLVNSNVGGAFTVVIDDDETYRRWARAFREGPHILVGAMAQLYSLPKNRISEYRVKPEDCVVSLSEKELGDLSRMEVCENDRKK